MAFLATSLVADDGQLIPVITQAGQITVGQITASPTMTTVPATATATLPVPSTPTDQPTLTFTPTPITLTPTLQPPTPTTALPPAPTPSPTPLPNPTPTPISPVTHVPPGATIDFCYRVQEGDTLYSLGQKFGMDNHQLINQNLTCVQDEGKMGSSDS